MKKNFENDMDIFSALFELQEEEDLKPSHVKIVPPRDILDKYNSTKVNNDVDDYVNSKYKVDYDIKVPQYEIDLLLSNIISKFNDSKYDELINECKSTVISSIVGPFGLGKVFNSDKDGGNITTIHNFEQQAKIIKNTDKYNTDKVVQIVASSEDFFKAKNFVEGNENFDREKYEGKKFKEKRKVRLQCEGPLIDEYTGKEIHKDGRSHLDHRVSAKEIHEDSKNHLFMDEGQRRDMAIDDKNLSMTSGPLNQSKGKQRMEDFLDNTDKSGATKGMSKEEKYGINREKALEKDREARDHINKTQVENQIKKQGKEIISTGANQALGQGASQAIGLILSEFSEAIFFEIKDIMNHGFKNGKLDERFIYVLKLRLNRIKDRVLEKWKYAVIAFKDGAISGFLSNIVTTIVNSFITTSKRLVRIIREGFGSLSNAFKLLLNPPKNMTKEEALHESSKLFATGLVLSGGILLEEAISTYMGKIPFGDKVTAVIVGIITGLTTVAVVYMIDKLDLLGVNRKRLLEHTGDKLDFMLKENIKQLEALVF